MRALFSVIALALSAAGAQAQVYRGNDTGGIIPWSCETEAFAHQIAGEFCARWDKYHRITSVHLPMVAVDQPLRTARRGHARDLRLSPPAAGGEGAGLNDLVSARGNL